MSRAQRLLNLIQILRNYRFPVTASYLAQELGISVRTVYRDIATLQEQGATIEGEPGLGYVLRPGFMLPPLMFSEEELEALILGSRWVANRTDHRLRMSAKTALAKIAAVLPQDLKETFETTSLLIGPSHQPIEEKLDIAQLRRAIRLEHKVTINYQDLQEKETTRTIWPIALGYFDHVRILAGWCELRNSFRHFRTERIISMALESQRYPRRRYLLLKEWRTQMGIPEQ